MVQLLEMTMFYSNVNQPPFVIGTFKKFYKVEKSLIIKSSLFRNQQNNFVHSRRALLFSAGKLGILK